MSEEKDYVLHKTKPRAKFKDLDETAVASTTFASPKYLQAHTCRRSCLS